MKKLDPLVLILFLTLTARASPQESAGQNEQTRENPVVIQVDVDLVNFEVFVENKGKPVTGLKPENFRIEICKMEKDGKGKDVESCEFQEAAYAEEINRPPIEAIVLIDTSASAGPYLNNFTKRAVPELVKNIGRPGDKFSFFEFVQIMNPLGTIEITTAQTENDVAREVMRILDPLDAESYGSKIFNSIYLAAKDEQYGLAKSRRENVFKLIILVTDGFDYSDAPLVEEVKLTYEGTDYEERIVRLCPEEKRIYGRIGGCREARKADIISALEEEEITLYVVDFSKNMLPPLATFIPVNHPDNMEEITDATGGRRILVANAREAEKAFEKIAESIKRTYIVGFYPSEEFTERNRYSRKVEVGRIDKDGEFKKYNYDIYTAERYVVR